MERERGVVGEEKRELSGGVRVGPGCAVKFFLFICHITECGPEKNSKNPSEFFKEVRYRSSLPSIAIFIDIGVAGLAFMFIISGS